jgi:tetratricopeptide (TPR) repeat protein
MKKITLTLLSIFVFFPGFLVGQVRETPVTLGLLEGGNPQGYIQNSNEQGILFATAPGGPGQLVPYARLRGEGLDKLIRYEERNEVLGTPRALFAAGKYDEAAAAFGKVARDYAILYSAPQNFASEALFYQMESIKRSGKYSLLGDLVNLPAAATINTKLADSYKRPFEFAKLWALFGANDLAGLKTALEAYQEPVTGQAKLLKSPNFRKLPSNEIAQLSFLRGKVFESEGTKDKALEDYYRTFTLANGNDILLSKLAMGAAMLIQKEDPLLAAGNAAALSQMQSIAYVFSKRFGKDTMPAEYQAFAVRPVIPKPAAPAPAAGEKNEPAPAPEEASNPLGGEKPAADAAAPKPE